MNRLENGKWLELGVWGADEKIRAEPFEAIEIDLAGWWAGVEQGETPAP